MGVRVCDLQKRGLFTEFINTFLIIKQETSSYLGWCQTDEDKKHIADYFVQEAVKGKKIKIVKNGTLRSQAKLMLNGENSAKEKSRKGWYSSGFKYMFKMMTNVKIQVNRVQISRRSRTSELGVY